MSRAWVQCSHCRRRDRWGHYWHWAIHYHRPIRHSQIIHFGVAVDVAIIGVLTIKSISGQIRPNICNPWRGHLLRRGSDSNMSHQNLEINNFDGEYYIYIVSLARIVTNHWSNTRPKSRDSSANRSSIQRWRSFRLWHQVWNLTFLFLEISQFLI